MKMNKHRWVLIVLLCLFLNSLTETLPGQDKYRPAEYFKLSLEELMNIEVASLFSESELEAGSTVHTVTRKDWLKYGAENLQAAISRVPSVFPLPTIYGSAISLRGYTNNLSVRGTAHLVDGVPVNNLSDATSGYEHPFYELGGLDRIEIISGPGSSIYGSDAFHGVLSLKTFESRTDGARLNLETGSDRLLRANLRVSRGLSKSIRIHGAAAVSRRPDQHLPFQYTHPFTNTVETAERADSYTSASGIFKVDARLGASVKGNLGLYYSRWRSDGFPSAGRFYGSGLNILQDRDVTGTDSHFYMAKGGIKLTLTRRLDLTIDAYSWRSSVNRLLDKSRLPAFLIPSITYDIKDDRKTGVVVTLKQEHNAVNTRWLLRYEYNKSRVARDDFEDFHPQTGELINSGTANADGFERVLNSIVFQAKTGVVDNRFQVVYGGRIDKYSDFGTHATPRLGLIYNPTPKSAVKLLYGNAFRAPTPNEALGSGLAKSNRDLKPETIDTYEFVFLLHNKCSRIAFTLFRSTWKNGIQVETIDDPVHNLQYKNTGRNEAAGLELSFNVDMDPFFVDFSGSYVDSRDIVNDRHYIAFPKYLVNLGLGCFLYKHEVEIYLSNRFFFKAHAGPVTGFEPDPPRLPVYARTDLNIQWRPGARLTLRLTFRNLFGRDNVLPSIWSVENGLPGEAFNVSLGLTYRF